MTMDGVSVSGVSAASPFGDINVDITPYLRLSSSNTAVAQVSSLDGRTVLGRAVGSVTIASSAGTSTALTVSAATGSIVSLRTFAYSGFNLSISSSATEAVPLPGTASPTLLISVAQPAPTASVAQLVTFALDDDGAYTDVSQMPGLTLTSTVPANLNVSRTPAGWVATAPAGAVSLPGGAWINATLSDTSNAVLQTGVGYIYTNLSQPVNVTVFCSPAKLTPVGNGASAAPFSVATSCVISVFMGFNDGSVQDVSNDARSNLTLSSGSAGCALTVSPRFVWTLSSTSSSAVGATGGDAVGAAHVAAAVQLEAVARGADA